MLVGGRLNSPGRPVIYGGLNFAGAMLEVLVHARIGNTAASRLRGGDGTRWRRNQRVEADDLPAGGDGADARIARQLGDRWLEEGRSAVLLVPSVVARAEQNVLVNPAHLDAARLVVSEPRPVVWDRRLFSHGK